MHHRSSILAVSFLVATTWSVGARADDAEPEPAAAPPAAAAPPSSSNDASSPARERDSRDASPITAYTYGVRATTVGSVGAQLYGVGAGGFVGGQRPIAGGGGTVWGSPLERLTLVGDGARDVFGNFAPSAAMIVRLLGAGSRDDGFSLGALGKYKIEGFGVGPNHEIESEIESGLLLSYARLGWHLDANAIGGMGLGDDGEVDAEARLRLGRDLGRFVRVGVDGQARARVAGATKLVGGRTWDFAGGPQVLVAWGRFFGAVTAGPATMGIVDGVGWTAMATVGGSL